MTFKKRCAMEGLGDIAVPGLLACLALRFDSERLRAQRNFEGDADDKVHLSLAEAFKSALAIGLVFGCHITCK